MQYPIKITHVEKSKLPGIEFRNIPFGKYYSDHMFIAEYRKGAWTDCRIVPYGNLTFSPATSAIHYGQSIFEGLKAYKNQKGEAQLFRPDQNLKRLNISAVRMGMPEVPEDLFMNALQKLVGLDSDWIPTFHGSSLYIRPFMYAADEFIGIRPTEYFKLIIITSPVSSYYAKEVKVLVADKYVRAFKGGVGFAKAAGNYGATMAPLVEAQKQGFDQVLWMDGNEFKYAQEIGTMNVFIIINDTVITPELDGTILDGVTRDSVVQLLKYQGVKVEERKISIDEILNAYNNGMLQDAFGTGTAASIATISHIGYKGELLELPPVSARKISLNVKAELDAIKTSKKEDPFNWIVKIKSEPVKV